MAVYDRRFETLHSLVSAADEALYDAKESGRNRVRVAPSEDEAAEAAEAARSAAQQADAGQDAPAQSGADATNETTTQG
ncbi:MAG: hypothetical protein R3E83_06815 [Burkholderiaceae bacterium]